MSKFWRVCIFSLLFSSLLLAEEIELKDGSKVTGKLTAIEGNVFHVKTAYGEIQVPRSDVLAIQFPENGVRKDEGKDSSAVPAPVDESLDGATYSNRTAHFQVTVPPGWTIAPELRKSKEIVGALMSPDQAMFFLVTPESFSGSLSTYRVLAETQYKSKMQDYEKLSESEIKLDSHTGLRITFKGKSSNTGMTFLVYILAYDDRMVRLTFFTLDPLFNDAVPIFEKIASSYHSTSDKPIAQRKTNEPSAAEFPLLPTPRFPDL